MYAIRKDDYIKAIKSMKTKPYHYPPRSLLVHLKQHDALLLSWAIWCTANLPEPRNDEEKEVMDQLNDYINNNLIIVNNDTALEGVRW